LSSYQIFLSPLRERNEDIPLLLRHFLSQQWARVHGGEETLPANWNRPWLSPRLMCELLPCPWSGNIRQLRNVARQLIIDNRDDSQLSLDNHLLAMLRVDHAKSAALEHAADSDAKVLRRRPSSISREELAAALRAQRYELQATAEQLGISRASVYQLIQRFSGFQTAQDIDEQELVQCFQTFNGDLEQMMYHLQVSQLGLKRRLRSMGFDV